MLVVASIAGLSSALAGCSPSFKAEPAPTTTGIPCPPVKTYRPDEMDRAARELTQLGPGSMLSTMADDYLALRDACR